MDYLSVSDLNKLIQSVNKSEHKYDQVISVVLVGSYDQCNSNHELGLVSHMIDEIVSKNLNILLVIYMIDHEYSRLKTRKFLSGDFCWLEDSRDNYYLIDHQNIQIKIIDKNMNQEENLTSILEYTKSNKNHMFIYQNFTGYNMMIHGLMYDEYLRAHDLFGRVIINTNRIHNSCMLDLKLDMNKPVFHVEDKILVLDNIYKLSFFEINKDSYDKNNLILNYKICIVLNILVSMLVDAIYKERKDGLFGEFCYNRVYKKVFSLIFEDFYKLDLSIFINKYTQIFLDSMRDILGCLLDDQDIIKSYLDNLKDLISSKDYTLLYTSVKSIIEDSIMNRPELSYLNGYI